MMKKRCMALTLAAVMAFSVTAFGASNPAQNGKRESAYGSGTVSAEKEMYQTLDRSILCADVTFALPENAQGKNLYLAMVDTEDWLSDGKAGFLPGSLEEWENNDLKQILNPNEQQIFTVPLTKDLLDLNVVYDGERKDGKSISLVALGGSQYADNLFAESEDQLLVQDLISLYHSVNYKNQMETIPCTIDVTIGADTMQVNGKSYPLDVPAYINDAGYTMLPMRALVENLPEEVQKKVVWDGQSKTALILCGMTTYRLTAGEKEALRNGDNVILNTPLEIKDGRVFLPLRDMIMLWENGKIDWEASTKTVHISAGMVHFLE
jgi:copper amine oxidase domain protein